MPSTRLENRILLCLMAFGISCGIGLLVNREIKGALTTGAIASIASFIGASVVDKKNIRQERTTINSFQKKLKALQEEISELENYGNGLRQSLRTATTVQKEIKLSIDSLNTEKDRLSDQVSDLQEKYRQAQPEISLILRQKQKLKEDCENLQLEWQQIGDRLAEQEKILADRQEQIQQNESCLTLLREEYQQLQDYISDIYTQKEQLDHDLHDLKNQKQQLLASVTDLQWHLRQLEAQKQSLIELEESSENHLPENVDDLEDLPPDWDELLDSI
jgi:chromosome segregation ATPase